MMIPPTNPLREVLDRLERSHGVRAAAARLFDATDRRLMPSRISTLCRPIDPKGKGPRPAIPTAETREQIHAALLRIDPSCGGLPSTAWDEFAAALKALRSHKDRRRKDVRRRLRLKPTKAARKGGKG